MSPYATLPLLGVVAALVAVDIGSASDAATISAQTPWKGARSPVTVPGTALKKGATIPRGARLVYRDVSLSRGQQPRFAFTATDGRKLRGLVPADAQKVGFAVVKPYDYAGKRSVLVRAFAGSKAGGRLTGRIYAYTR
jgi:hypothetical protein